MVENKETKRWSGRENEGRRQNERKENYKGHGSIPSLSEPSAVKSDSCH